MTKSSDFITVDKKKKEVVVEVNPQVFPIDLVYSASYDMLDRAHIVLDGSPDKVIKAILRPRNFKGGLRELGEMFYDGLISSAFHTVQFVRNKEMRESLMNSLSDTFPDMPEAADDEDFDETEIAQLWEDKFGKEATASKNGEGG